MPHDTEGATKATSVKLTKAGNECRRCGYFLDPETPHSWVLGPQAGHYCFGCEPWGHFCKTVNESEAGRAALSRKDNSDGK